MASAAAALRWTTVGGLAFLLRVVDSFAEEEDEDATDDVARAVLPHVLVDAFGSRDNPDVR